MKKLKETRMGKGEFKDYTSVQKQRIEHWKTAIGLQAVDGLQPSEYLYELAGKHIEGQIDINEVQSLLNSYYENKENRIQDDSTSEADKVSANIMEILHDNQFCLCADEFRDIHDSLFHNVLPHAGIYRLNNFIKKEWVLQMDTVEYGDFRDIENQLDEAMKKEGLFDYESLTEEEGIKHLADFIAEIWKIHPFFEGNTRTTAIFAVKYLRSMGKNIDNEIFRNHSLFFRNALARANYSNAEKDIKKDPTFLYKFFMNLLAGQENRLRNRDILVSPPEGWNGKEHIEVQKKVENKMSRLTEVNVYKHNEVVSSIKCNIDGVEQKGKNLKITDLMKFYKLKESSNEEEINKFLSDLALKYYDEELNKPQDIINHITDTTIYTDKDRNNWFVKCKVDGEWRMAETISENEINKYKEVKKEGNNKLLEDLKVALAKKYFGNKIQEETNRNIKR